MHLFTGSECAGMITRLDADYLQVDSKYGFWLPPRMSEQVQLGEQVHLSYDRDSMMVTEIKKGIL